MTDALDELEYQYDQQDYHKYGYHQVQRPAPHPNLTSLSFGRTQLAAYIPFETPAKQKGLRRSGAPIRDAASKRFSL